MTLGDRLSLITGDNGLGKSFLLESMWYALTQTWTGEVVLPSDRGAAACIYARLDGEDEEFGFQLRGGPLRV